MHIYITCVCVQLLLLDVSLHCLFIVFPFFFFSLPHKTSRLIHHLWTTVTYACTYMHTCVYMFVCLCYLTHAASACCLQNRQRNATRRTSCSSSISLSLSLWLFFSVVLVPPFYTSQGSMNHFRFRQQHGRHCTGRERERERREWSSGRGRSAADKSQWTRLLVLCMLGMLCVCLSLSVSVPVCVCFHNRFVWRAHFLHKLSVLAFNLN